LAPLLAMQHERGLHVLEVGSFAGHSAAWIAENLLGHDDSRLTCVDPWLASETLPRLARTIDAAHAEFRDRIRATGREKQIKVCRTTSHQELPRMLAAWRGVFDFVYIDGSHEAPDVLHDSVLAIELLRVGGILIWDDYRWRGASGVHAPKIAIDAVLAIHAERLRVLHAGVQVAVEKLA
jgi:predicted O-methyltransferase YrrM